MNLLSDSWLISLGMVLFQGLGISLRFGWVGVGSSAVSVAKVAMVSGNSCC